MVPDVFRDAHVRSRMSSCYHTANGSLCRHLHVPYFRFCIEYLIWYVPWYGLGGCLHWSFAVYNNAGTGDDDTR